MNEARTIKKPQSRYDYLAGFISCYALFRRQAEVNYLLEGSPKRLSEIRKRLEKVEIEKIERRLLSLTKEDWDKVRKDK